MHSDSNTEMERSYSRKHKASSPLDSMTTKKYCEHQGSEPDKHDTGSHDTYLTKSPEIDMLNRTYPHDTQRTCTLEFTNMESVQLDNGPTLTTNSPRDQLNEHSANEA